MLARRAIERADVVVLVIDALAGPTDQDGAIAGAAVEAGRGIDHRGEQVGPDEGSRARTAPSIFDENLRHQLKFLDFAPILHISAATGRAHAEAAGDHREGGRRRATRACRPAR